MNSESSNYLIILLVYGHSPSGGKVKFLNHRAVMCRFTALSLVPGTHNEEAQQIFVKQNGEDRNIT